MYLNFFLSSFFLLLVEHANLKMSHYDISSQVPDSWLIQTKIDIHQGKTTLTEAAKHVIIDTVDGYREEISVHRNTLRSIFEKHGIKVYEQSRKGFKIAYPEEIILAVKNKANHLQCGITKIFEALYWDHFFDPNKPQISKYAVQRICQENLLFPLKPKKMIPKIRVRYLVSEVNGAWHGDIHYVTIPALHDIRYLFGIIDDRSRMIVGFNLLESKEAAGVIQTLDEAIKRYQVTPFVYWSDNGGENIARSVIDFLDANGIVPITTKPGNPQSNGKIERFWPNVEKRIKNCQNWDEARETISNYIPIYNNETPHSGLELINGRHPMPGLVFTNPNIQKSSFDNCKIRIDRQEISLSMFVRHSISKRADYRNIDSLLNKH